MNKKTQIALLKKYKIPVRGQSGQHLLIDPNLQKKLTDFLHVSSEKSVLEIGPGLGALTAHLLGRGVKVIAVEKDARFVEILNDAFAGEVERGLLTLICEDVLDADIDELIKKYQIRHVISNLPYYITSPVFFKIFKECDHLDEAVFMMQAEVAERLLAKSGSKTYGRLAIMSQYFAEVKHVCDVPPRCFAPPPDVNSTVLHFDFTKGLRLEFLLQPEKLEAFIKLAFSQRRKAFLSVLKKQQPFGKTAEEWKDVFLHEGIEALMRPEQIEIRAFLELARSVCS